MQQPSDIRKIASLADYPGSCLRVMDFINRNDTSKYSDRSAFKSAMTGVAGFSGSHLERLIVSPARQQSYVGKTPHIICPGSSASSRRKSSPKRQRDFVGPDQRPRRN
jgi:hypothetical protein